MLECLDKLGVLTPNMHGLPIIEVPLAQPEQIGDVGRFLFENGIYVTLAAYPLVPRSEVGFRIQLTTANADAEIDAADRRARTSSPTRSTCSLRSDRPPHDTRPASAPRTANASGPGTSPR